MVAAPRIIPAERWISTDDGGGQTQSLPTIPAQDPVMVAPALDPARPPGQSGQVMAEPTLEPARRAGVAGRIDR
jgi:hypothetical protein